MLKALLAALLEPTEKLREFEQSGDYTGRLAMLEALKSLPLGAVWDFYWRSKTYRRIILGCRRSARMKIMCWQSAVRELSSP